MKWEKVSYSQLFSFGNFQNETIGCTVILEENDNAVEVLNRLKDFVEAIHDKNMSLIRKKSEAKNLDDALEFLDNRLKELTEKLNYRSDELERLEQHKKEIENDIKKLKREIDEIV